MFIIMQPLSGAEAGVAERNNFLTQVLSLAEKPRAYFIVNLDENKISMMAKGIVIREWAVDELCFTGEPVPVSPFSLVRKSINMADLRNNVDIEDNKVGNSASDNKTSDAKPGNGKTDDDKTGDNKTPKKYEVIAMEIDDMPTDYELFLNGEVIVSVISRPEGAGLFYSLKRYAYYPILTLWASFKKSPFTKIDILFKDKTEAQALFWAFSDGTECIILPPGSANPEDFQL